MFVILQLYGLNKEKLNGLKQYKDYCIESNLSTGDKVLSFLYPLNLAKDIVEEGYIRNKTDEFVIKEVSTQGQWKSIKAKLNVENLEGKVFESFETVNENITDCINLALAGTGWIVGTCDVTKRRTVRKTNASSWEIIQEAKKVYRCELEFNTLKKKINIYEKRGTDKGVYFLDSLNLKDLSIQSDSYDFYTRIIAKGKDDLKVTLENFQYSSKVKTYIWKDERYTDIESLTEDAEAKLDELSKPYRAYSATVIDLANMSEEYKDILSYSLGDVITLVSKENGIKEKQRIVKIVEYPDEPYRNTCEIANTTLSFEDIQKEFQDTTDTVNNITTDNGTIDGSTINGISTEQIYDFESSVAKITDLTVVNARIDDLYAKKANISELNTVIANVAELNATKANVSDLNAINANIQTLFAADATINNALIGKADIKELNAVVGNINTINSEIANIKTLVNGNLSSENIQAGGITSDKLTIANGFITNAMIANLDVSKINAGDISTNKFRIVSDSGKMLISDNTIQIRDNNRVRVQIGKDASNDYNMYVWDSAGKLMFDATGLKADGIKNKIIRDDMISDNANIDGSKINISSLITEINKDTNTSVIKSSKVQLDTVGQTLEVAFNSLKSNVDNIEIGGRNLFLNSGFTKGLNYWYTYNCSSPQAIADTSALSGYAVKFTSTGGGIYQRKNGASNNPGTYPNGTIFTVSGYVKSSIAGKILNVNFENGGPSGTAKYITCIEANKWYYFTHTYTLASMGFSTVTFYTTTGADYYLKDVILEYGNKATTWTPAPEDIDSLIESVKQITESNSTTINVMQGQINTAINNTQIVKDGQTILLKDDYNRTVSKVDSINSTIGTHSTKINELTGSISSVDTKVNSVQRDLEGTKSTVSSHTSQINGLNSTVSTQGSNISQLKNQIALKVEQTDITNAIGKIEIGGRNLIRNANFETGSLTFWGFSEWRNFGKVYCRFDYANNFVLGNHTPYMRADGVIGEEVGGIVNTVDTITLEKNQVYTLSYYRQVYRCHVAHETHFVNSSGQTKLVFENCLEVIDEANRIAHNSIWDNNNGDEFGWKKVTVKFRTTDEWYRVRVQIVLQNSINDGFVFFDNFKLEKGNVGTDFTLAPEDMESSIATVDSKVETVKNEVAQIKVDNNSITQRVEATETVSSQFGSGINKWLFNIYDGIQVTTFEQLQGISPSRILEVSDWDTMTDWRGDNMTIHAITHLYCSEDFTYSGSLYTDDGSSLYVNGNYLASFPSCNATEVSFVLKAGWNTVELVICDGIFGEGFTFTPMVNSYSQVKKMNAYGLTGHDTRLTSTDKKVSELKITSDSIIQRVQSTESSLSQVDGKIGNAVIDARKILDTRNDNYNPQHYMSNFPRQTTYEFKIGSVMGVWETNFGVLETNTPWGDESGGLPIQTFRSSSSPTYERQATSKTEWGSWVQVEDVNGSQAKVNVVDAKIETTNNRVSFIETTVNGITSRVEHTENSITNINNNKEDKNSRYIFARGTGQDFWGNSFVTVQGTVITDGQGRGLRINTLDPRTLNLLTTEDYDTYGDWDAVNRFNARIEELNNYDYIIIITSYDASHPLRCKDYLRKIGGSLLPDTDEGFREAYALIGRSKLGEGNGVEMYIPRTATDHRYAEVSVKVGSNGEFIGVNSNNSTSQITSLTNRISSAEQKITESAIINTVSNVINNAKYEAINSANGTTDSKLQNYVTTSSLTQNTDSIIAKFSASGGYNLIIDSRFKKDFSAYWWYPTSGTIYRSEQGVGFFTPINTATALYQTIAVKPYTTYTLSATLGVENATEGATLGIELPQEGYRGAVSELVYGGISKKVSATITTGASTSLNINIHHRGSRNHTGGYVVWISELLMTEGELVLPWSPHPEEIYSGSTMIDSTGITVNNGALRVKNNDGTTVLEGDSSGNLTLKNGCFKVLSSSDSEIASINQNNWMRLQGLELFGVGECMQNKGAGVRSMKLISTDGKASHIDFNENDSVTYTVRVIREPNSKSLTVLGNGMTLMPSTANTPCGLEMRSQANTAYIDFTSNPTDDYHSRVYLKNNDKNLYIAGSGLVVEGNLKVNGSKNCLQTTQNYGERLINAYETTECYYGDLGFGKINADGECLVHIDDIFTECINTNVEYHVFTQIYNGAITSIERFTNYFIVKGTPNTEFSWELKAKRLKYENVRLDTIEIDECTVDGLKTFRDEDFAIDTAEESLLNTLTFNLEDILMEG